jgi:hypothetical protein
MDLSRGLGDVYKRQLVINLQWRLLNKNMELLKLKI